MANLVRPQLNGPRSKRKNAPGATPTQSAFNGATKGSTGVPSLDGEDDEAPIPAALSVAYRSIVGAFCKKCRKAAGMTQAQVGELVGVGHTAISGYETGRGQLPPGRYEKLADLYGLDRAAYGKFLLRYTNPWIYVLLFGNDSRALARDLGYPTPNRYKLVTNR